MKASINRFLILVLLLVTPVSLIAQNKAWATLENGVLRFTYGAKPQQPSQVKCRGCGQSVSANANFCPNCGRKMENVFYVFDASVSVPCPSGVWPLWRDAAYKSKFKLSSITKVVFDASFSQANITCTSHWFYWFDNLTEIVGLEYLNTSNVTDMSYMFDGCSKLMSINLSNFDTHNVINMENMFNMCQSIRSIDVSRFNTSKVTDMGAMFSECYELTEINVSKFDTRSVTSMSGMFGGCRKLKTIDLTNFNTNKVTDMSYMFDSCFSLLSVNVSSFNTSKVTDLCAMFDRCKSLTTLDISSFDTRNAYCDHILNDCINLKTVYVSSLYWRPKLGSTAFAINTLMDNCNATIIQK